MKFNASTGGHVPGHIRDAFAHAVENTAGSEGDKWWEELDPVEFDDPQVTGMTQLEFAAWLLGQLWNCTDFLPVDLGEPLECSTYAQAARKLKPALPGVPVAEG